MQLLDNYSLGAVWIRTRKIRPNGPHCHLPLGIDLWYAIKYENADIVQLLLNEAEKDGISVRENDMPMKVRSRSHYATSGWCDICTLGIQTDDMCYHCTVCSGGDFDICLECYEIGGRCLEVDHQLIQEGDGE